MCFVFFSSLISTYIKGARNIIYVLIITYESETRQDSQNTEVTGNDGDENTKKNSGRIKSEDIRRKCNVQGIKEWTLNRKRGWNRHIIRMKEIILVKIARNKSPRG